MRGQRLSPAQRRGVNRVFVDLGKAIAAYERRLGFGESKFDGTCAPGARDDEFNGLSESSGTNRTDCSARWLGVGMARAAQ
ncbi:hypothetical protein [Deinococcus apachensis]|uniref:hypothetical protein n=1 Tax=Deinococcus apachensis TaxID=309886 RepID=UPI00035D38EF|nr:hypothetical protein [Deinococcus apachensis]